MGQISKDGPVTGELRMVSQGWSEESVHFCITGWIFGELISVDSRSAAEIIVQCKLNIGSVFAKVM